ncbi:MAG TPA: hypothetical protein VOA80_05410, partial [Thermoanaerobaculia bacterium]|nr:hypothetical protein [Thermoanaerobaculia bacterium]
MDEILRTRLAEVKRTLERASLARLRSLEDSRAVVTDPSMRYSMAISVPTLEEAVLPFMPNRWGDLEIQFGAESKDLHEKIEALEKRYEGLAAIKDDERQRKELSQLWQVYTDLE